MFTICLNAKCYHNIVCGCVVIKNVVYKCFNRIKRLQMFFICLAYLRDEVFFKTKMRLSVSESGLIINNYKIFDFNQNKIKSIPHKFQVPSGVPYIRFSL